MSLCNVYTALQKSVEHMAPSSLVDSLIDGKHQVATVTTSRSSMEMWVDEGEKRVGGFFH